MCVQHLPCNRRAYRRMIINFVWAFGYNVLAIPVAAGKQRLQWLMAWYFCLLVAGQQQQQQQQQQPLSLDLSSQLCPTQLCKQVLISHCSCASRSVAFDNWCTKAQRSCVCWWQVCLITCCDAAAPVAAGVLYPLTHQLMPPWVAAVAMAASRWVATWCRAVPLWHQLSTAAVTLSQLTRHHCCCMRQWQSRLLTCRLVDMALLFRQPLLAAVAPASLSRKAA
jgi:hypothetical protein